MNTLLILNDPPYGSERSYNGLRLTISLTEGVNVRVFLTGDAVACAMVGQKGTRGASPRTCWPREGQSLFPRGTHGVDPVGRQGRDPLGG